MTTKLLLTTTALLLMTHTEASQTKQPLVEAKPLPKLPTPLVPPPHSTEISLASKHSNKRPGITAKMLQTRNVGEEAIDRLSTFMASTNKRADSHKNTFFKNSKRSIIAEQKRSHPRMNQAMRHR